MALLRLRKAIAVVTEVSRDGILLTSLLPSSVMQAAKAFSHRVKARRLYAAPQWSCASQAETTKPLATDSKVLFLLRSPPLFFTELGHGSCSISCCEAPSRWDLVPASAVTFPLFATVKLSCLTQVGLTVRLRLSMHL